MARSGVDSCVFALKETWAWSQQVIACYTWAETHSCVTWMSRLCLYQFPIEKICRALFELKAFSFSRHLLVFAKCKTVAHRWLICGIIWNHARTQWQNYGPKKSLVKCFDTRHESMWFFAYHSFKKKKKLRQNTRMKLKTERAGIHVLFLQK